MPCALNELARLGEPKFIWGRGRGDPTIGKEGERVANCLFNASHVNGSPRFAWKCKKND